MSEEVMIPKSYHDKVCEEMARRHQAEILELTADRPSNPHDITYINALKNRIKELEADRPQGEWEMQEDADGLYGICSVCGQDADFSHYYKAYDYCPSCGARMKGASDDQR